MTLTRRDVLAGLATTPLAGAIGLPAIAATIAADRFDPWLEIDPSALRENVATLSRLADGRPILAVIKNNAYGLGLTTVASILEPLPEMRGFAVVKTAEAIWGGV